MVARYANVMPRPTADEPAWTIRLRATDDQQARIRDAARRADMEIGAWVLQAADVASLTSAEWRRAAFTVVIPASADFNRTLDTSLAVRDRLDSGLPGLGSIAAVGAVEHPDGLDLAFVAATQSHPTPEDVARLVDFHIGVAFGVRVTSARWVV